MDNFGCEHSPLVLRSFLAVAELGPGSEELRCMAGLGTAEVSRCVRAAALVLSHLSPPPLAPPPPFNKCPARSARVGRGNYQPRQAAARAWKTFALLAPPSALRKRLTVLPTLDASALPPRGRCT
ncbi:Hypothetical predicted protein [Cloeon dipterum]|uniref:Uncharacterized protein n=1 Tax=Cloeon dipterum TaxID=197152 RepID=A0A8S1DPZ3_9INSE|nr:Hypothetical predicted protein [Cloeon dipterum]